MGKVDSKYRNTLLHSISSCQICLTFEASILCRLCTLRSLIDVFPCYWFLETFPPRTSLFHTPRLLNLGKCSSHDIFKSRQWQKTLSIFLLKFFVTDYLLSEFPKSLHCHYIVSKQIVKHNWNFSIFMII